jgi:hypothetical protein
MIESNPGQSTRQHGDTGNENEVNTPKTPEKEYKDPYEGYPVLTPAQSPRPTPGY